MSPSRRCLAADEEFTAQLDDAQIAECFDLRHVLRHVDGVFERVLGKAADTEQNVGTGVDEERVMT